MFTIPVVHGECSQNCERGVEEHTRAEPRDLGEYFGAMGDGVVS